LLAGWFVTEIGRQPYLVYGLLRTAEAVSPVNANQVGLSLIGFVGVYFLVFGAGVYYIARLIAQGPQPVPEAVYGDHGLDQPAIISKRERKRGGQHV
jgi:cytochrome d ubiquinol oxidase subunit I